MSDKLWKQCERAVGKFFGGVRNPVHGSGPRCDVSTPTMSIEVKERAESVKWLDDAVSEAVANCESGKLPAVVLHTKGRNHNQDYVIIKAVNFAEWYL